MTLVTEATLRGEAERYLAAQTVTLRKSASDVLVEKAKTTATSFDIFLSNSVKDEKIILGIYAILQRLGFSVYVDWIVDPKLDRTNVSADTAEHLRTRMRQSKTLIYAYSLNAASSKWMPWELGYFDGFRQAVAVLPVAQQSSDSFKGQEYLGLYPNIDLSSAVLWVNKGSSSQRLFGKPGEHFPQFKRLSEWVVEKSAA